MRERRQEIRIHDVEEVLQALLLIAQGLFELAGRLVGILGLLGMAPDAGRILLEGFVALGQEMNEAGIGDAELREIADLLALTEARDEAPDAPVDVRRIVDR